jgi:hypothetical protein
MLTENNEAYERKQETLSSSQNDSVDSMKQNWAKIIYTSIRCNMIDYFLHEQESKMKGEKLQRARLETVCTPATEAYPSIAVNT